jgi:hypothetical protein
MKKKSILIVFILVAFESFGQFDGSYTGISFDNKKVLIKIKIQATVLIGTLYESKTNAQSFFGNIENNGFSASINFKNMFKTTCIGEFKNDSLFIKIPIDENIPDKYVSYLLKRSPKSIDLDKYFYIGEKTYPIELNGTWKSLEDYHFIRKEYIPRPEHKLIFGKNGMYSFISSKINSNNINQMNVMWYVAGEELFTKMQVGNSEMEFGQKYVIKGDTLVLSNSQIISKYLKIK